MTPEWFRIKKYPRWRSTLWRSSKAHWRGRRPGWGRRSPTGGVSSDKCREPTFKTLICLEMAKGGAKAGGGTHYRSLCSDQCLPTDEETVLTD